MVKVNIVVEEKQWKKNNKKIEFFLKKITNRTHYWLYINKKQFYEKIITLIQIY